MTWAHSYTAQETVVYVMKSDTSGHFKIGHSRDPEQRLKTLRRYVPDLKIIDMVRTAKVWEIELHRRFNSVRVYGEWFALSQAQLDQISELFRRKRNFDKRESLCTRVVGVRG